MLGFHYAEIGLTEAPATNRVAEPRVLLPAPGVDIRLFGRQQCGLRAGACAVRRSGCSSPRILS